MLDLCYMAECVRVHGSPSPALVLVTAFHAFYVADALWFEASLKYDIKVYLIYLTKTDLMNTKYILYYVGVYLDHDGHCSRWVWVYVGVWRSGLGTLPLQFTGQVPIGAPTAVVKHGSISYTSHGPLVNCYISYS